MTLFRLEKRLLFAVICTLALVIAPTRALAQTDPGPRGGAAGAGGAIAGITVKEGKFFDAGLESFGEVASVYGQSPERSVAIQDSHPLLGSPTP